MEPYSLYVVEDEDTIRQGLVHQVPWEKYGFRVAAEAGHGREALERLRMSGRLPDVVLTDVKMPVLNGIDLMAEIRRLYPAVKIVILSGYGEFEYAQKAIEYGAFAYLLKPTKEKNIEDVFLRLKAELDSIANSKTEALSRLQGLKEKFVEDIQTGRTGRDDDGRITAGLREAGVDVDGPFFVLQCRLGPGAPDGAALRRLVEEGLGICPGCRPVLIAVDREGRAVTVTVSGRAAGDAAAIHAKQALAQSAEVLCVGVSRIHDGVLDLPTCLAEADNALQDAFYAGRGAVVCAGELAESTALGEPAAAERQIADRIAQAVANGNDAAAYAGKYMGLVRVLRGSPSQMIKRFSSLLAAIEGKIAEKHPSRVPDRQVWLDRLSTLVAEGTVEDAGVFLDDYIREASRLLRPAEGDGTPAGVAAAIELINANFRRKLTLEEAAGAAYMTPSYFSRQFKAHTGQSFIDYLTSLRVEEAKDLLQNADVKIYEVAMGVGYEDYRHFCKVFRRLTGMSPMGYKAKKTGKPGVK